MNITPIPENVPKRPPLDGVLSRIKNQGYVSCVDPNKLMIEQGRKKLKYLNNIQWHVSSAENLPFKDNIFDIYSVSFGVRNFSDTQKALREALRSAITPNQCLWVNRWDVQELLEHFKVDIQNKRQILKSKYTMKALRKNFSNVLKSQKQSAKINFI